MTAAPEIAASEADAPQVDAPQVEAPPPAVRARALQLHADRGAVYGPVDLDLAAGALTLIQGPQGAGRTSLLLTLAGRMVPDAPCDLVVLGHRLPGHRGRVQLRDEQDRSVGAARSLVRVGHDEASGVRARRPMARA